MALLKWIAAQWKSIVESYEKNKVAEREMLERMTPQQRALYWSRWDDDRLI